MNIAAKVNKGYDYAQQEQKADDLDRWQFASEVVGVVVQTPPDWSVRIGVFAKWGEGKTTVLKFLETMLKEKGSIVFTFSPWSVQSWEQLWDDFGLLLYDALRDAGAHLDGSLKRKVKSSGKFLEKKGIDKIVSGAAATIGKDKIYDATVGALGKWLKYDAKQIREIRNKLPGTRVVVLIDDLDRCDPQFLPQLLLSLREVLDLPGFVFVLAFDDEIVAEALTDSNRAWKNGSIFLEKILDFRFHLPTITDLQKRRFVANAMATYCPFVPQESVTEVLDLLPNNPRKLKSLIRSLTSLKGQIERHDSDELNWVDMWLAQMLKLESNAFFERLLIGNTLEKEVGTIYKVLRHSSDRRRDKEQGSDDDTIKQLMKDAGVEDPRTKERLTSLIIAIRARASTKFEYICGLAMRPHAVTWKEFRSFFFAWQIERKDSTIKRWIERHARDRSVTVYDVENELFESVINRRNECLMLAADASTLAEHDAIAREAESLLDIIRQDLRLLNNLSADRFKKMYGQISAWIGFRTNATDISLRVLEEKVLLEIAGSANNAISCELLPLLYSQRSLSELGEGSAERLALQKKCIEVPGPKACLETVGFVNKPQGINSLRERGRYDGVKFCLFNSESPLWTSYSGQELIALIKSGRENDTIYENAQELFSTLTDALAHQVDFVSQHESSLILRNHEFANTLWETVTFRTIQYRMRIAYLRGRKRLIEIGIPEDLLPMSAELQARMKEILASQPPSGDSQELVETI
ncbi:MAG: P-loop NTPase fold protein [Candidatus Acidiferrum sp.]